MQLEKLLAKISEDLYANAEAKLQDGITTVEIIDDARDVNGIIRVGLCGEEDCGLQMSEYLDKDMLGVPIAAEDFKGQCGQCGKPTETVTYFAMAL